jgi:hypothetical protein
VGVRRRGLLVVLVALAAGCASSDERADPTTLDTTTSTTTSTSTSTTSTSSTSTTTTTSTVAPPTTTTTTAPGRAAWPSARAVDEALGLELTVTTSSQDIGRDERATFVFRIRNTSTTEDVVYDANTDFISLQSGEGGEGGGHWAPFCGARTAVLVFETLRPGESIGGHDVAYPGDRGPEPCPRPPAGDYELVVRIYGCRQPPPQRDGEGTRACDDGRVGTVGIPVRQR